VRELTAGDVKDDKEATMAVEHPGLTSRAALGDRMPMPPPPHRLDRLREWMAEQSLDACLVFGAQNIAHLGGYARYYGGPAGLVIGKDGARTLVVMFDEVPVARSLGGADDVTSYGERGFGINLQPLPLLADAIAEVPEIRNARRVGISDEIGGLGALLRSRCDATQVDASGALHRIRLIKDEDELVKVLHSYELCWLAQAAVAEQAKPGMTEIELFSTALSTAQNANGYPIEFLCDLLSGPKTADVCCPIHIASPRVVEDGEGVVADIVVSAHGYWGDSAETHTVGANDEIAQMRAALLEILAQAASELRTGNTGAAIFEAMRARIEKTFPGGEFPHHGGHGLALTAFEDPHIIPSDNMPLENWMLIAIEPGVYFPGRVGARVENVYIVTPGGGVELRDALGAR
jgi:Xaa-Pro aminopeptidase